MKPKDRSYYPWIANIEESLLQYAQDKGLDFTATGGGCDFICLRENENVILSNGYGESPESLSHEANVVIYSNDEWNENYTVIKFNTAIEAIHAMSTMRRVTMNSV